MSENFLRTIQNLTTIDPHKSKTKNLPWPYLHLLWGCRTSGTRKSRSAFKSHEIFTCRFPNPEWSLSAMENPIWMKSLTEVVLLLLERTYQKLCYDYGRRVKTWKQSGEARGPERSRPPLSQHRGRPRTAASVRGRSGGRTVRPTFDKKKN